MPDTASGARPSVRFNVRLTRVKQATSSSLNDEAASAPRPNRLEIGAVRGYAHTALNNLLDKRLELFAE